MTRPAKRIVVYHIRTPSGWRVPRVVGTSADEVEKAYARLRGQTWESLQSKGYRSGFEFKDQ